MAQEDEIIRISVETNATQAAQQANQLVNSLNNVDESAAQASGSMRNLDASFEEVYGDLKPLTARMGEAEDRLYELGLAGKKATTEYQELLQVVARYRQTQIETDRVVDAAASTLGQRLGGAADIAATSVSFATSGMALFGDQSADTEKALLKVQAAMAFADSVKGLVDLREQFGAFKNLVVSGYARIVAARQAEIAATTQATIAQRLLNLTALANPYVLLASAIAAVTVVTYAWIKSSEKEAVALEKATDAVEKNISETNALSTAIENSSKFIEDYNTLELARARALGATDRQIQTLIQSQKELSISSARDMSAEAYENLTKAREALAKAIQTDDEELVERAEENAKKAAEIYKSTNDGLNNAIQSEAVNRYAVQADNLQKQRDAERKAAEQRLKDQQDAAQKRLDAIRKEIEAIDALTREKNSKEAQLLKENQDLTDKTDQQKLDRQIERAAEEVEVYRQKGIDTNNIERLNEEKFLELQNQLNEKRREERSKQLVEEYEADADAAMKRQEAMLQQEEAITKSRMSLADSFVGFLRNIAGKNKALQKASIIAESALGIGKSVIETNASNVAATAQGAALAIPTGGASVAAAAGLVATNYATLGIGTAATIAATAKALQALGGGSSGGGAAGGGATQATGGARPNVAFNNTAENQIGQSIAGVNADQPPIKVVVAESDITEAQGNVKVLVEKNTFG